MQENVEDSLEENVIINMDRAKQALSRLFEKLEDFHKVWHAI